MASHRGEGVQRCHCVGRAVTGAESAKYIGKQGRLHGAGVPWGVPVVVIDTRNSYGRDQLLVIEPKLLVIEPKQSGEPVGKAVWVEASRVEVMP